MTKIKICGLTRPCDIAFVNAARPDFCGFVVEFPKSRRSLTADQVRALRQHLAPGIVPVGVFVDASPEAAAALLRDGTLAAAQLHGHEDSAYIAALRRLAPQAEIWQAVQMRSPADAERAMRSPADRVLLDSGQGSGRTFDWALIARVNRPFLLAGGLTPENLKMAIRTLHPWGVDLSSGVETDGVKDPEKIQAAVAAAREEEHNV